MHANQRRKSKQISDIQDISGNTLIDPTQIGDTFSEFFSNLFTSSNPQGIDQCLEHLQQKVTNEDNSQLLAEFTEQQIFKALFTTNTLRALGLDGFSAQLY